jgi:hypothetical protein
MPVCRVGGCQALGKPSLDACPYTLVVSDMDGREKCRTRRSLLDPQREISDPLWPGPLGRKRRPGGRVARAQGPTRR